MSLESCLAPVVVLTRHTALWVPVAVLDPKGFGWDFRHCAVQADRCSC